MPKTMSQVRRSAKLMFRWCLIDGDLDEGRVRKVVNYVLRSKRRGYLALLDEFKRLLKLEHARHTARVESAVQLESDLQLRLRKGLERVYGEGLSTEFLQNPELIAGIRIRVASDVYDSSVKSKLAALATTFGIRNG
ncbi:MAG TPA: F0F1 ATP synthase subunit delta [Candidatus Binatia bacterium]|nr:F0F1 ATP synthase subunit delta [Candidatus Binatia bacterium]